MSLYAHTTLSRSVCEAAIRHAWLLNPSISYEQRITRNAAMLFANAENQLTGVRQIPALNLGASTVQRFIDNCAAECDQVRRHGGGPGARTGTPRTPGLRNLPERVRAESDLVRDRRTGL